MGEIITITDDNADNLNVSGRATGLVPRNFKSHPPGYLPFAAVPPSSILIPEGQWDALIAQQEAEQSSLQHLADFHGVDSLDQNGQGYCWAYSTTAATMLIRIVQGLEHEPLSGHMIGCIIKGYRDEGGWNAQSLEFARTTGIASQKLWPQGSMSRSNDTPAMRADAAKRKVTEWWDLPDDRTAAKQYLASLLLRNIPVMIDLNWWGHSVCAVRLMKRDPFTVRIRNSWANSWGDRGYGDLVGSKAVPDGAAAPRVTVISQ